MVFMPGVPLDSISITLVCTAQVETVEVGRMACSVPPAAFEPQCTATGRVDVIVHVERREIIAAVSLFQRISYKFN